MTTEPAGIRRMPSALTLKRLLIPLLAKPRTKQILKWIVYSALLINFGFYFVDDYLAMRSALPPDAPFKDFLTAFSTTIDMFAWLGLVFLFELETYALPDEAFTNWLINVMRVLRAICYAMIFFAAYGYTDTLRDSYNYAQADGITSACDAAGNGTYLQTSVIDYVEITPDNCASLTDDSKFYRFAIEVSHINESLMGHVHFMYWIDVLNAVVWLIVVFLIEVEVRLQAKDRFWSPLLGVVRTSKTFFYLILIGNGVIWAATEYWLYTWDAFLWIFGFWAIELNLAEWEQWRLDQMEAEQDAV